MELLASSGCFLFGLVCPGPASPWSFIPLRGWFRPALLLRQVLVPHATPLNTCCNGGSKRLIPDGSRAATEARLAALSRKSHGDSSAGFPEDHGSCRCPDPPHRAGVSSRLSGWRVALVASFFEATRTERLPWCFRELPFRLPASLGSSDRTLSVEASPLAWFTGCLANLTRPLVYSE